MCVFRNRLIEWITSDAIDPDSEVVDCSIDAFFLFLHQSIYRWMNPIVKLVYVVKLVGRLIEKIDRMDYVVGPEWQIAVLTHQ